MEIFIQLIVIPIILMILWELFLRDLILPNLKKFSKVIFRWLKNEHKYSQNYNLLKAALPKSDETKYILEKLNFDSLSLDGAIELIHSHLYRGWDENEILYFPLEKNPPLPDDLKNVVQENPPPPPNNGKYRLISFIGDSTERPYLQIKLAATDYFNTYPIQKRLFQNILNVNENRLISPFDKYYKDMLDFGDHPLPNIVCLHIIVCFKNKLLLSQRMKRKDQSDWEYGKWSCSIEEQMTVKKGDPRCDKTFHDAIYAGLEEELGVKKDKIITAKILSLILESNGIVIDPIAFVNIDHDFNEIKSFSESLARDGQSREIRNLNFIEFKIENLLPILWGDSITIGDFQINSNDWHATSKMRVLNTLFHKFGVANTVKMFKNA